MKDQLKEVILRNLNYFNNIKTVRDKMAAAFGLGGRRKECFCLLKGGKGELGEKGGNGGEAGKGGEGGYKGNISIIDLRRNKKNFKLKIINENGTKAEDGKEGIGGKGGQNGKNGIDHLIYCSNHCQNWRKKEGKFKIKYSKNRIDESIYLENRSEYAIFNDFNERISYQIDGIAGKNKRRKNEMDENSHLAVKKNSIDEKKFFDSCYKRFLSSKQLLYLHENKNHNELADLLFDKNNYESKILLLSENKNYGEKNYDNSTFLQSLENITLKDHKIKKKSNNQIRFNEIDKSWKFILYELKKKQSDFLLNDSIIHQLSSINLNKKSINFINFKIKLKSLLKILIIESYDEYDEFNRNINKYLLKENTAGFGIESFYHSVFGKKNKLGEYKCEKISDFVNYVRKKLENSSGHSEKGLIYKLLKFKDEKNLKLNISDFSIGEFRIIEENLNVLINSKNFKKQKENAIYISFDENNEKFFRYLKKIEEFVEIKARRNFGLFTKDILSLENLGIIHQTLNCEEKNFGFTNKCPNSKFIKNLVNLLINENCINEEIESKITILEKDKMYNLKCFQFLTNSNFVKILLDKFLCEGVICSNDVLKWFFCKIHDNEHNQVFVNEILWIFAKKPQEIWIHYYLIFKLKNAMKFNFDDFGKNKIMKEESLKEINEKVILLLILKLEGSLNQNGKLAENSSINIELIEKILKKLKKIKNHEFILNSEIKNLPLEKWQEQLSWNKLYCQLNEIHLDLTNKDKTEAIFFLKQLKNRNGQLFLRNFLKSCVNKELSAVKFLKILRNFYSNQWKIEDFTFKNNFDWNKELIKSEIIAQEERNLNQIFKIVSNDSNNSINEVYFLEYRNILSEVNSFSNNKSQILGNCSKLIGAYDKENIQNWAILIKG